MGLEWIGLDQQQFVNANLIGKLILRLISGHKKMHALRRAAPRHRSITSRFAGYI
jgi:hypothetical protein